MITELFKTVFAELVPMLREKVVIDDIHHNGCDTTKLVVRSQAALSDNWMSVGESVNRPMQFYAVFNVMWVSTIQSPLHKIAEKAADQQGRVRR